MTVREALLTMRNTPEEIALLKAIEVVRRDTAIVQKGHIAARANKPLMGWSQEKHEAYYDERIAAANAVLEYLFIRSMQIDPD